MNTMALANPTFGEYFEAAWRRLVGELQSLPFDLAAIVASYCMPRNGAALVDMIEAAVRCHSPDAKLGASIADATSIDVKSSYRRGRRRLIHLKIRGKRRRWELSFNTNDSEPEFEDSFRTVLQCMGGWSEYIDDLSIGPFVHICLPDTSPNWNLYHAIDDKEYGGGIWDRVGQIARSNVCVRAGVRDTEIFAETKDGEIIAQKYYPDRQVWLDLPAYEWPSCGGAECNSCRDHCSIEWIEEAKNESPP
jgi:hypothetical protein